MDMVLLIVGYTQVKRKMMNEDIITVVKDLSVSYSPTSKRYPNRESVNAVDGVSLEIIRGASHALIGESGSGKTTLALVIVGVLEPQSGLISYNFKGLRLDRSSHNHPKPSDLKKIWKRIGIVFQDPYSSLDPHMLVKDAIIEPFLGHGLGGREEGYEKAKELLIEVGMDTQHLQSFPHQLSGGQRQRVNVARALITDPELIVFDEPTSSLDVSVQAKVLNAIAELKKEKELTYLFITHDIMVARHMAEYASVMYGGRIMENGSMNGIFMNAQHPYSNTLLSSVPMIGKTFAPLVTESGADISNKNSSGCVFRNRCYKVKETCGWTSYDLFNIICNEMSFSSQYLKKFIESKNDRTMVIKKMKEIDYAKIISFAKKNKFVQDIDDLGDRFSLTLSDQWDQHLVKLDGEREVSCVIFDTSFQIN